MNKTVTRTRLRKGLVKKKSRQDENGVTNEELDVLLAERNETQDQSRRPACRETGRKRKKALRRAMSR